MSSIYIHIPYCKQACSYCNFHFSTTLRTKAELVDALCKEIELEKDYLGVRKLESIYLGGGTPSILDGNEMEAIFNQLSRYFEFDNNTEITIEANPDDIDKEKLQIFKSVGINRLSIGIQTFFQDELIYMNRAHDKDQAVYALELSKAFGFNNITADLIYGGPYLTNDQWIQNIQRMIDFEIPHISSYCLTIEEGTALHHKIKNDKSPALDEEKASVQFSILSDMLTAYGFEHYEISNFGKPGFHAVHNSNYWKGKPYLGIGPAAHSYDGHEERRANIAHNIKYIAGVNKGVPTREIDVLTERDRVNEYLLIRLRMKDGVNIHELKGQFPDYYDTIVNGLDKHQKSGKVIIDDKKIYLSGEGRFFADGIAADLFII